MIVDKDWLAKEFNCTKANISRVISQNNIEPEYRIGNKPFFDFDKIKQFFRVKSIEPREGEITPKQMIKKYNLPRNLIHGTLRHRGVQPLRQQEGYKGTCFYDAQVVEDIFADFVNHDFKRIYAKRPELVSSTDIDKMFNLQKHILSMLTKRFKLTTEHIHGYGNVFYYREKVFPVIEKYLEKCSHRNDFICNPNMITRAEIQEKYGFSRQRAEQIFSKLAIKPVFCVDAKGGRLPGYFYDRQEVETYFEQHHLKNIESSESLTTVVELRSKFGCSQSHVHNVLKKANVLPVGRLGITGSHAYNLSEALEAFTKYATRDNGEPRCQNSKS